MDISLALWQLFILFIAIVLPTVVLYKLGKSPLDSNRKLLWCLIVIFIPFFGSLAYLLVGAKTIQVSQQ
ncbi:MAG: PLD nuclease N-terminal domain-containing protein [Flavobacteriaceae bacterium]|jgi:hypothetical protein|nr:PLD nuclease N-terminal domain-containing protein [Flavobacteriaceae bacterium]